jgi:hypothetical protein
MSKFYSSGVPLFLGDSPSPVFTAVVWAGFLPMSCIQSRRTTELYSDQCGAFNLTPISRRSLWPGILGIGAAPVMWRFSDLGALELYVLQQIASAHSVMNNR